MTCTPISIHFEGSRIRGSQFTQTGSEQEAVLLLHGFSSSRLGSGRAFVDLARKLTTAGFEVFSFDRLGHGESDGLFKDIGLQSELEQIKAMVHYVKQNDCETIHLVGHSLGAMEAACVAAEMPEEIATLTLWAPAAVFAHEIGVEGKLQGKSIAEAEKTGIFDSNGQALGIGFIQEAKTFEPYKNLERFTKPVFIHHGQQDEIVPVKYAERYAEIWNTNSQYYLYGTADHGWTNLKDRELLFDRTVTDLKKIGQ